MSVRAHRILTHPKLADILPSDLLVLCRILAHLNEKEGVARPGIHTLREQTGLSERTVQRAIKRIESAGVMTVEVGGGRTNANRYYFTNPVIQSDTVSNDKPRQCDVGVSKPKPCHLDDTVSSDKPRHSDTETPSNHTLNPVTLGDTRTEERRNGEGNARDNGKNCKGNLADPERDTPTEANPGGKQTAYTFQTTTGPWTLTKAQRDDLRERYPFIHVDTELGGLANWTDTNPDRRKKPGAMHGWLRARLVAKQAERRLENPAYYGDGFAHKSLPSDPTPDELERIMADD